MVSPASGWSMSFFSSLEIAPFFPATVKASALQFDPQAFRDGDAAAEGIALPEKMKNAVAKRKAEYVAGRLCAMRAIEGLCGVAGHQVAAGERGEPVWPDGLIGSITHTKGFAAAVAARNEDWEGLGIDTEEIMTENVMQTVKNKICRPEEWVFKPENLNPQTFATLIFSAKESLFKCLYPLVRRMFWFEDARIVALDAEYKSFSIELLSDLGSGFKRKDCFSGFYYADDVKIHTFIGLVKRACPS
nr:4'-phosphopantetheinyl transferase superfamily protein [Allorhizobium sonneratiae]